MRFPLQISPSGAILSVSGYVLLFLAARFLGGPFIYLFRFWWLIFLLDGVLFVINAIGVRYYQDFDTDHIAKGDFLTYILHLEPGFNLPIPALSVEFHEVHTRGGEQTLPDGKLSLMPGEIRSNRVTIHAALRGIYTVGLSRLTVHSYSGLMSLDFPIWSRTFYVYPRLIHLPGKGIRRAGSDRDGVLSTLRSETPDVMKGLREYRAGDSLRYVSWKKFQQTGSLFLREFSSIGYSRVHLILDRRSIGRDPLCEDTVLESLLSVADAVLRSGDEAVIHGFPEEYPSVLSTGADLDALIRLSLNLKFDSQACALPDLSGETGVFLFTALADFSFLDQNFWLQRPGWHLIPVLEDMDREEQGRKGNLLHELRLLDVSVTEVQSGGTIQEDLACLCSL